MPAGLPMTSSRLVTLKEAAALVPDDAVVALGGFAIARNAIAFVNELIRQGRRGLTVTQTIVGRETDLLVGAGCVERLVYGGGSLDRFGQVACIGRAVESGAIRWESYSTLTMTLRYLAGSLGIPFIPTKSLLQSDVLRSLVAAAPAAARGAGRRGGPSSPPTASWRLTYCGRCRTPSTGRPTRRPWCTSLGRRIRRPSTACTTTTRTTSPPTPPTRGRGPLFSGTS